MDHHYIYKIFRPQEWAALQAAKIFVGSPDDLRDGFIHFSCAEQVAGTLAKYYTDGADIVLAQVETAPLEPTLKFEISRDGVAFPHLYNDLTLSSVRQHWVIAASASGAYELPDLT